MNSKKEYPILPMNQSVRNASVCLLLLLFVNTRSAPQIFAAPNQETISVTPSTVTLDLKTDKPQAVVTYTNATNQEIQISLSASDFTQLEDGYKLSYIEGKDAANYKYKLSSWISFDQSSLVIPAHSHANVTVFVNQNELTPGAHYASILATIQQRSAESQIQIQEIISSLLFVRTNTGKEIDEGKITSFDAVQYYFSFPNSFVFHFQNTGDTTLTPHGLIQIFDPFKNYIGKGIANEDSLPILPESIRSFTVPTRAFQPFLIPGIYQATFTTHFGNPQQEHVKTLSFFTFGSIPLFGFLIISVGLLCFLLVGIKKLTAKKKSSLPHD